VVAQAEAAQRFAEQHAGGSPLRPAGYCSSPQWMRPLRKVPVVMMVARRELAAVAELEARQN
jgi:hypothetical protein